MSDRFDDEAQKIVTNSMAWSEPWHVARQYIAHALRRTWNEAIEAALSATRGITLTSIEPPMSQEAAFETCRQVVLGVVASLKAKEPTDG